MDTNNNFSNVNTENAGNSIPKQQPVYQQQAYQQPVQQPTYQQTYQQPVQQPTYQQPVYNAQPSNKDEVVGMGTWFLVLLGIGFTSWIPVIGLVVLCLFAFVPGKESRKNYAKLLLILRIVGVVLSIIAIIVLTVLGVSLSSYIPSMYY